MFHKRLPRVVLNVSLTEKTLAISQCFLLLAKVRVSLTNFLAFRDVQFHQMCPNFHERDDVKLCSPVHAATF